MRSHKPGKRTSTADVEVQNISPHGIWLWVKEREFLLTFEDHPWFREATVAAIHHVVLLHGHHLHWPELDVDLELESLLYPDRYPLTHRRQPTARSASDG